MIEALPLARGGLERAAGRRRDPEWLAEAWSRARVLLVDGGGTLVSGTAGSLRLFLVDPADLPAEAERYFLGIDPDGVPYFAVRLAGVVDPTAPRPGWPDLSGARTAGLREAGQALAEPEATAAVTAVALAEWHRRAGYAPSSGQPTTIIDGGWARVSADRTETFWPRTDPAVIALVHDGVPGELGGRCLLAHNATWRPAAGLPRYSCLAGFVEPGESAEQTVQREIAEEVGLAVHDVRYVASQPWPFPGSLMLGFVAVADPLDPLRPDAEEIHDARWFTLGEVRAALAGRSTEFTVPLAVSIANHLLSSWADGTL